MTPRRRIWFRVTESGKIEAAALARNDDPGLEDFLKKILSDIELAATKTTGNK